MEDESMDYYRQALGLVTQGDPNPTNAFWNLLTGSRPGAIAPGDLDRAITYVTQAIQHDPHQSAYYSLRAVCFRTRGDSNQAIADLTRAIELDPRPVGNYIARGMARVNTLDYNGALHDYTQVISLDPQLVGCQPRSDR